MSSNIFKCLQASRHALVREVMALEAVRFRRALDGERWSRFWWLQGDQQGKLQVPWKEFSNEVYVDSLGKYSELSVSTNLECSWHKKKTYDIYMVQGIADGVWTLKFAMLQPGTQWLRKEVAAAGLSDQLKGIRSEWDEKRSGSDLHAGDACDACDARGFVRSLGWSDWRCAACKPTHWEKRFLWNPATLSHWGPPCGAFCHNNRQCSCPLLSFLSQEHPPDHKTTWTTYANHWTCTLKMLKLHPGRWALSLHEAQITQPPWYHCLSQLEAQSKEPWYAVLSTDSILARLAFFSKEAKRGASSTGMAGRAFHFGPLAAYSTRKVCVLDS